MLLSFKRDGESSATQHHFQTRDVSADQRQAYRIAVMEALARCTPLPFSRSLGHAVAGRPFNIRFVDERKLSSEPRGP